MKKRPLFTDIHTTLYEGPEPGTVLYYFKDKIMFSKKALSISGKGVLSNRISSFIHEGAASVGIPTSYMTMVNMREQIMVDTVPLKFSVTVRNMLNASRAKELDAAPEVPLQSPMIEFSSIKEKKTYIGSDSIESLGWATKEEIKIIKKTCLRLNDYLTGLFHGGKFQLVDFTTTFGRLYPDPLEEHCNLLVTGQFSPETFSLIDMMGLLVYPIDKYYKSEIRKKEANQNFLKPHEIIASRLYLHKKI